MLHPLPGDPSQSTGPGWSDDINGRAGFTCLRPDVILFLTLGAVPVGSLLCDLAQGLEQFSRVWNLCFTNLKRRNKYPASFLR